MRRDQCSFARGYAVAYRNYFEEAKRRGWETKHPRGFRLLKLQTEGFEAEYLKCLALQGGKGMSGLSEGVSATWWKVALGGLAILLLLRGKK